jgi:hypothetical protein
MPTTVEVPELEFTIGVDGLSVGACIAVPPGARGVVIIPLRSSEGRCGQASRDRVDELHRQGMATVLLDLLTVDEQWVDDQHPRRFFGDELLARRLAAAVARFLTDVGSTRLPVVVLGAGTALPIVQRASLPVPTIVSLVGDAPGVRGRAHNPGAEPLGVSLAA